MQRRFLGLTAAGSALGMALVLSGCGESVGTDDTTLTMVAAEYGGKNPATSSDLYWSKIIEEYESKHPGITVDVEVVNWREIDSKVAKMVKDGEAPDMAQIGAYSDYAAAGELYSADELLSIPVQADFLPKLAEAGEVNRIQYGMPFASSTRLLFYNKAMFRTAGLAAPQTWDELEAAAQALKAQGVKYPVALPLGQEEAQAETLMWMLAGGSGYTDNAYSYSIASKENVETLTWLRDNLVKPGLTGPVAPGKFNREDAFAAFTQGEVGMLNGHPTLMEDAQRAGVEVGKVALPGPDGKPKNTLGVTDWMMGFKQKGHREQIGDFLDFVYSTKNVTAFSSRYDILPVTGSAYQKMSDSPEHKNLDGFLAALPTARLYPVGKTSWPGVSEAIKKTIGKAVEPGGNPESILGRIERDATAAENAE